MLGPSLWLLSLSIAASGPSGSTRPSGPLCHSSFRSLEECLGHDHERLQSHCNKHYSSLRSCLERDWVSLDSLGAFEKPPNAFNRLKPCRHGLMLYNPLDWYIGRSLEVYGEWAEKKVQLWARFIQPGDVAIDVGAHVGTLALPLSKLVGAAGRVFAFEPFYPSFAALAANTGLNSLENVEVIRAVLAQTSGKMRMDRGILAFQQHDFFNYGSMDFHSLDILPSTEMADASRSRAWDEYLVMKLDSLSLSRLDFLKVDAEAMELEVLKGASSLLSRFKPLIFVEYRSPKQKKPRLLQFLRKLHYECVLLRMPIFNEQNFRRHQEDIWSGAGRGSIMNFNLFCRSTQRDYPQLGDVATLFSTAVETDIPGLRSTPRPDPFDVIASAAASKPSVPKSKKKRKNPTKREDVKVAAGQRVEEMSMEELLDLVDPPRSTTSTSGPAADVASRDDASMSFEEFVDLAAEVVNGTGKTMQDVKAPAFPSETTLDEL